MKTKLVYVVVCKPSNIYFEQCFASAWSAKYHNPDIHIVVVMDRDSRNGISPLVYKNFNSLVDEEIVREFDSNVSSIERSRWLKTNLRTLVSSDFMYIDSDTIISSSLSSLDSLTCSVGFVSDWNCNLNQNISRFYYKKKLKRMFNQEMRMDGNYFNGGVFYAKDDDRAHRFLNAWHENWKYCQRRGYYRDQLSLLKTTQDLHHLVDEIDGTYNCQMAASLQYFTNAKILHFYHLGFTFPFSPFFEKEIYKQIKKDSCIAQDVQDMIVTAKNYIAGPAIMLGNENFEITQSHIYKALNRIFLHHKKLYSILQKLSRLYIKCSSDR